MSTETKVDPLATDDEVRALIDKLHDRIDEAASDNRALARQNDALRREVRELRDLHAQELRSEVGALVVEYIVGSKPTKEVACQRAEDVAKLATALANAGLGSDVAVNKAKARRQ